jgi:hypothetical protein
MIRVHVICEGQTEEMFVNEVLSRPLAPKGVFLFPSLIGKPWHKGGNIQFERLFIDVRARLLSDDTAYCTTFFDYYGLPSDFPGKDQALTKTNSRDKAACVVQALSEKLTTRLGEDPSNRFIPYIQMHEFEGLLFSDVEAFAHGINKKTLENSFGQIRKLFISPEEINDSPETAPGKRIKELFPEYEKPIYGSLAALEIGIDAIRRECPLFDGWVTRLETLEKQDET